MSDHNQQQPSTESVNEQITRVDTLARIDTMVSDMHHRLFGNGQPGIVAEYNNRLKELEAERNRVIGMVKFVRFVGVLTPLMVGAAEGYRLWLMH